MINKIQPLYESGKSCAQIAEIIGTSTMTVYRLLKKSKLVMRERGSGMRGKKWTDARRVHHPAKPERDPMAPTGYEILTARSIGNKTLSKYGYVVVSVGRKKRQYEHILIVEKVLGRPLPKGLVVHHINCNRADNRPENLLVCTIRYHLALHARMRRHPYWKQFPIH